ncbi:sulfoxide reductase heme-binding subunit YedZ [Palleronia marisminoris]|uniref:Protein-methionine-sulfoxide reductase heme-binding subunit MsrQ n=1 Tax=Palleronia marisminoris TaxID=315423 RepID=A0A1Y5TLM5_9RHOB|nr:protein-methionine-sulfoxide reductase heme-binding subunit MsrQ [Palleronia marisminoris]SFH43234.1 sulfoxide reductase heme-binding subunit YedZ [Palleronia marisminoris]SLN66497.1 Sulfoxide reductase heme-binding subunit YedZ [Palleronia marisminoris]
MSRTQRVNAAIRKVPSWLIYFACALLPLWYFYLALTGGLGVEPINGLELALGDLAMKALVLVLAITPFRKWTGLNLVPHRRAIGVIAFFYVLCHLLTWAVLDVQSPARMWADIVKRPYITIGMAAFVLLLPVAITSNNLSIRRLGPMRWRRLHMLTYVICALGAVHYVMVQKVWEIEPLVYLAIVLGLLATRIPSIRREFAG